MATAAQSTRKTPEGIPWKPGQSGNPGGRPKGIASKARELIGNDPTALLGVFLEIAQNPKEKAGDRRAAAESLLDRAYGKAPIFTPIDGEDPLDLETLHHVRELVDDLARHRADRPVARPDTAPADGDVTAAELAAGRASGAASA